MAFSHLELTSETVDGSQGMRAEVQKNVDIHARMRTYKVV
jgi:hypothetical protein